MGRPRVEIIKKRGENLKELLKREGITQLELSERINLTQQTISKIINGTANLTDETAKKVIEEFPEYSYFWLIGLDRPMLAIDASHRVVNLLNGMASHQKDMFSNMLEIICDCGYSVALDDQLTIKRKSDKKTITLTKAEARSYYDELQNMIESFVRFHFERRKEK